MFDKVNMTITCTTETRERPAEQPGQAARRRLQAGSSLLSWCWAVLPLGAARHTPEPLRWPPPLPRV